MVFPNELGDRLDRDSGRHTGLEGAERELVLKALETARARTTMLKVGAYIDAADQHGRTALMHTAWYNSNSERHRGEPDRCWW